MFHLFDQEGKSSTNEAGTTQPSFSDEKLDEIQMLQQAQSRLPAFCPHSSPFSTSCRSILSSFEWYAEEPLVGIDGAEPLLERPTVNFLATSTADHRTDLDQVLLPSEDSTTTGEDLMHRLSVQHVENCPSIIAADSEVSPPFVVDTSTVSCRSRGGSPTPASPLTDLPIDDVDQAAPQFASNTDMSIQRSSAETDANVVISQPASFDAQQATPMDEDATIGDAYDDCDSDSGRNEDAGSSSCRDRDADDSDDEDAEEEPQLSPRLVDARALYEAYLQTGEKDEWSSTSSDGDALSRSEDDDSDDDSDGGVLVEFGEWQDQRALHRRNEDFPYHTYKPPLIGDGFQAALPSLLSEEQRLLLATTPTTTEDQADSEEDDGPRQEELMWSPDSVNDELVEDYLAHVRELVDHDDFSEEKALVALHRHSYDANGALASLLVDPEPFHKERWSDEEKIALVTGWGLYFKNWQKIQTMVPTRSTGEIMQFYYQHKPRADYIRRQNQAADDESESEESEEEELIGHLDGAPEPQEEDMDDGAKTTPSSPSSPSSGFSSPHRPLPHQTDLASVHMPLGEDESDHEVERQVGSIKRRWADPHAREADDNNDDNEGLEPQHTKKRKRDEAAVRTQHYREDNVDGADGEGNDKSEEDEERSAAAGTKRARLDRGGDNNVDQGDDGDVWSREEETTPRGTGGQLDGASL